MMPKFKSQIWRSPSVLGLMATGICLLFVVYANWQYLIPRTNDPAVLTILRLSGVAIVVGFASAIRQCTELWSERRLLTQLGTADLVKAVAAKDNERRTTSESVVLRHAKLVSGAIVSGQVPPGDYRADWRRQALERTGRYGGLQRFLASTLLLLAVLGTFAGMKAALPQLSGALTAQVRSTNGAYASQSRSDKNGRPQLAQPAVGAGFGVTKALDLVGNAFGSNFAALLGSLTLAAFGYFLGRDRRALVIELEDRATSSWYPMLRPEAGVSSLERAVAEMKGSVAAVARVGESMDTLNHRLADFKNTLIDCMQQMVGDLRATMQASSTSADSRHDAQLVELTRSLTLITRALERTTIGYEGLVKGLEERDLGVAKAASALIGSVEQLGSTSELLTEAAKELEALRKQVSRREGEYQKRFDLVASALQSAAGNVFEAAATQATALQSASESVTLLRAEQQVSWNRSAQNAEKQLQLLQATREWQDRLDLQLESSRQGGDATRSEVVSFRGDLQRAAEDLGAQIAQSSRSAVESVTLLHTEQQVGWTKSAQNADKQLRLLESTREWQGRVGERLDASHQGGEATRSELAVFRGELQRAAQDLGARIVQSSRSAMESVESSTALRQAAAERHLSLIGESERRVSEGMARALRELKQAAGDDAAQAKTDIRILGDRIEAALLQAQSSLDSRPIVTSVAIGADL